MVRDRGKAAGQPRFGLRLQFGGFGGCGVFRAGNEARQDRLARDRAKGAALGDLDRVLDGFRQIGKQSRHLALWLEIMLGREPAPVVFRDVASFRDAEKRVVGFENIALFEIGFVGGDERHAIVIGPTQELGLNRALATQTVPLDLDIKALAENGGQRGESRFGLEGRYRQRMLCRPGHRGRPRGQSGLPRIPQAAPASHGARHRPRYRGKPGWKGASGCCIPAASFASKTTEP